MNRKYQLSSVIILLSVYFSLIACKKDNKIYTPVPFLTGRTWIADTITINPPLTFSQLSNADQQSYRAANGWFHLAKMTLNDDGTVTVGGDYDLGYKTWRLVNNNADIEMTLYNGTKQVLQNWMADAIRFSYTYAIQLNTTFDCTFVFK